MLILETLIFDEPRRCLSYGALSYTRSYVARIRNINSLNLLGARVYLYDLCGTVDGDLHFVSFLL